MTATMKQQIVKFTRNKLEAVADRTLQHNTKKKRKCNDNVKSTTGAILVII